MGLGNRTGMELGNRIGDERRGWGTGQRWEEVGKEGGVPHVGQKQTQLRD